MGMSKCDRASPLETFIGGLDSSVRRDDAVWKIPIHRFPDPWQPRGMNRLAYLLSSLLLLACGAEVVVEGSEPSTEPEAVEPSACVDEVLAFDALGASSPVIANGAAYWATADGGIFRRELFGSSNRALVTGLDGSASLAVRGTIVYFTVGDTVARFDEATEEIEVIASEQSGPFAPTLVGDELYWLNRGSGIMAGELMRWRAGGVVDMVLDSLDIPTALATDGTHVYVLAKMAFLNFDTVQGALLRIAVDSGEGEVVERGIHQPAGMAVTAERIYWIEQVDESFSLPGRVMARDKDGGDAASIAGIDGLGVTAVADTDEVMFSVFDSDGSRIRRVARDGGEIANVAVLPGSVVGDVAIDADYIVVTSVWSEGAVEPATPSVQRLCRAAR
ncbi:hypothetical protein JYT28_00135 [Desulfobulbus sp. AH-315-M07]|nr:hypothetical protein [Desulfobulbus sp. AH-315-M07]